MKVPPKATRAQAEKLGFFRPSNGGEGKKYSNLYQRGDYEAVSVDETFHTQWWYRPVSRKEAET